MSKRAYTQVQALVPEIQETLYLSMIRDLYDNSIIAYKTAAHRTANLVLDTIRLAIKRRKRGSLRSYSFTATKDYIYFTGVF